MAKEPTQVTETQPEGCGLTRRDFIKFSTIAGGTTAAFLGGLPGFSRLASLRAQSNEGSNFDYTLLDPKNQLYSVCLQCNSGCGIKVKLLDGVAAKIEGNPFHPTTMYPHIPYETPVSELGTVEGAICPKGQAGLQSVYDPYRLASVLKRKPGTNRGENQWETISFEQAIEEVVEGGDLFGEGPVPGLRESYALTDKAVSNEMIAAIKAIQSEQDRDAKLALVDDFKDTFSDHLDAMIDPDHPDLGPRNNQFVFAWGRLKNARKDFIKRFLSSYGTLNAHGHTTVCQGSLYFTGKAMSEQYIDGKWQGGSKFYWQGDVGNSEFVIFVGASPFEANYGPPLRTPRITTNLGDGTARMVVVDPRFSKTASKAWKWLPGKPGTEAALALAMIQWIIDNERYDGSYLSAANAAAAEAVSEPTWTESTWLVKLDDEGTPGNFLRASEIGLREKEERPLSTNPDETYDFDYFVALVDGEPVAVDPYAADAADAVRGDLLVDTEIEGIRVKSGLQIISDAAHEYTIEEWADLCGLDAADIIEVSAEFTSHGKRAVADIHRGVSQHTNGFYNVLAWYTLNALIGNYDYAGGLIKASTYKGDGSKPGQPFNLKEGGTGISLFGTSSIRHGEKYENHTLFLRDGYPAPRHWYYLASDVYQEIIPSIGDAYPYPVKAMMLYMGSPVYSLPAGHTNIETLADPAKLPLFISIDPFIGETSMYADYIFPDTMYLERWEFQGSHPSISFKIEAVRNPTIAPMVPDVTVYGQQTPLSLEAVLMGIAERLELESFGEGAFGSYGDLVHPDEFYLKMVANLAVGEKADGSQNVPDANEEEIRIFLEGRRHLPDSVFNADRWRAIVGDELWPKVVYLMNRGGRFDSFAKGYTQRVFPENTSNYFGVDTQQTANRFGTMLNLYQEKTYNTKNPMTGEQLTGYAKYFPAGQSVLGEIVDDTANGYDLNMITYKVITQTKSRTASNYWLLAVQPENTLEMHPDDAAARNLVEGDMVRVSSASNTAGEWDLANGSTVPMVGKLRTTQGIRPGVVAFGLGFGHWSYGGVDFTIDGTTIPGDARRVRGFHANAAMRVDPYLGNTTLIDPVGGSAVFYDTMVKIEKV